MHAWEPWAAQKLWGQSTAREELCVRCVQEQEEDEAWLANPACTADARALRLETMAQHWPALVDAFNRPQPVKAPKCACCPPFPLSPSLPCACVWFVCGGEGRNGLGGAHGK